MKKTIIGMTIALSITGGAFLYAGTSSSNSFSKQQNEDIQKIVADYIAQNPEVLMTSLQKGMERQQQAANEKIQKSVAKHKEHLFKDKKSPAIGNAKAEKELVVFMDPYCGYCRKFHTELDVIVSNNKNLRVIFKDVPFMAPESRIAIEAMLAANLQGKYHKLQQAIFTSDGPLDKEQLLKIATSLGIDAKKLETDMQSKEIKNQVDETLKLAQKMGINATPMIIIGESKVIPGYVSAEELQKALDESA